MPSVCSWLEKAHKLIKFEVFPRFRGKKEEILKSSKSFRDSKLTERVNGSKEYLLQYCNSWLRDESNSNLR